MSSTRIGSQVFIGIHTNLNAVVRIFCLRVFVVGLLKLEKHTVTLVGKAESPISCWRFFRSLRGWHSHGVCRITN